MDNVSIKDYISRAKELEVAIFAQKRLMEEHENYLISQRPRYPNRPTKNGKSLVNYCPIYPQEPPMGGLTKTAIGVSVFLGGFILYVPITGASWANDIIPYIMLGIIAIFVCLAIKENNVRKEKFSAQVRDYHQRMQEYKAKIDYQEKEEKYAEEQYQQEVKRYNVLLNNSKNKENRAMVPHKEALRTLEDALTAHYATNILFPKYRNLVAVSTIDEYLQSGRCNTLEGGDGAYNLYEMELRQNIIIGHLSMILDNMEQIKGNQFTLYQEISNANIMIKGIMTEMREMKSIEKLNTYFAAVNAMAATAPKYIHGHIY